MTLAPKLILCIQENGPLTVADYMGECNAYYYATRDPFGIAGDFTTSPEISQIFGELIGAWILDLWQQQGEPQAILCELGPGRGTLMKDALRSTRLYPSFADKMDIQLVETSPRLREMQKDTLKDAHPRISWHDTLQDLPELPLFLIANEFFDALPVTQQVKVGNAWQERKINYINGTFAWLPEEDDIIREISPASFAIIRQIAQHIKIYGGAALIIDYGYMDDTGRDSLQAVRDHNYANILENPGEADLTAHVDFGALYTIASKTGVQVWSAVEQGIFLKRLGAELRAAALCKQAKPEQQNSILSGLERLVAPHGMGTLFKVMAITSTLDKPAGF